MKEQDIPDLNIFMMCEEANKRALSELPDGYHIRNCRPEELDLWKGFPFDTEEEQKEYCDFMSQYFDNVYGKKADEFFSRCLFVCEDETDKPVATCFAWKAYDRINTIHWFKTLKEYEGRGLGRALLSHIMRSFRAEDYPVFLHTQPGSFRAIGLYSDLGFRIVTDQTVGHRENHYEECLPILKQFMREDRYHQLQFAEAPPIFDECAKSSEIAEF